MRLHFKLKIYIYTLQLWQLYFQQIQFADKNLDSKKFHWRLQMELSACSRPENKQKLKSNEIDIL